MQSGVIHGIHGKGMNKRKGHLRLSHKSESNPLMSSSCPPPVLLLYLQQAFPKLTGQSTKFYIRLKKQMMKSHVHWDEIQVSTKICNI